MLASIPDPEIPTQSTRQPRNAQQQTTQTKPTPFAPPFLGKKPTDEQLRALTVVREGRCVLMTGAAGSGTTFLLQLAVSTLREKYGENNVFVAAPTASGACAVHGVTLDILVGADFLRGVPHTVLHLRIARSPEATARWRTMRALVIADASQLHADLLDNLDALARDVRRVARPFGGVQIILAGDFVQTPPPRRQGWRCVFEAGVWRESGFVTCVLSRPLRQHDGLATLLEAGFLGCPPGRFLTLLRPCFAARIDHDAAMLLTTTTDAIAFNKLRLADLDGAEQVYTALDTGNAAVAQLHDAPFPERVVLKRNALVVLTAALPAFGLHPGALGHVVDFVRLGTHPEPGRSSAAPTESSCHPVAAEHQFWLRHQLLPVVEFGGRGRITVRPHVWQVMLGAQMLGARVQLPLALGWGIAIGQAAGMTLDRIIVDLSQRFDMGQLYASLARAPALERVRLVGAHLPLVDAWEVNPVVVDFLLGAMRQTSH